MASGKSTVARMLEEKRAYRIVEIAFLETCLLQDLGVQEIVRVREDGGPKNGRLNRHHWPCELLQAHGRQET